VRVNLIWGVLAPELTVPGVIEKEKRWVMLNPIKKRYISRIYKRVPKLERALPPFDT